ncbi:MAG: MFS transporter [Candidatus Puniceispirillaceae bacterium]
MKSAFLDAIHKPQTLLMVMAAAMPLSFWAWTVMLNNFTVDVANFTGREIGILQSLREVPGFLSFLVVYLLFFFTEQRLALLALGLLGAGVALTGYFPFAIGLYITTIISSLGFHYYEACNQSLTLQWLDKKDAPTIMGRIYGVGAAAQLLTIGALMVVYMLAMPEISWEALGSSDSLAADAESYQPTYLVAGLASVVLAVFAFVIFPRFEQKTAQRRQIILRKRYWLYYALTFIAGARRQIFLVFASFLMVEKFDYSLVQITLLFLVNAGFNIWLAPIVGRIITKVGERAALVFEYLGLIGIFVAYAFVDSAIMAAGLYVLDHLFFAFAIAIKTYFQKIGDPADMASTASVAFTINHIAAVIVPVSFGLLWLISPAAVFLSGAAMAGISLLLSLNVPRHPEAGAEIVLSPRAGWGTSSRTA